MRYEGGLYETAGYETAGHEGGVGAPDAVDAPAVRLSDLRARVRRLEGGSAGGGPPLPLGWPAVDAALGGGLAASAVHEVFGPAAPGFALRWLGRLHAPVLWIHPRRQAAALYGAGLVQVAPDLPQNLIVTRALTQAEGLWAAEEGLRSGAPAAVVLTPAQPVGLTESRRLQLAAERGRIPALLIGGEAEAVPSAGLPPSAAATRWCVAPAPSRLPESAGATIPRWRLRLLRRRGGGLSSGEGAGGDWIVESGGF